MIGYDSIIKQHKFSYRRKMVNGYFRFQKSEFSCINLYQADT